MRFTIERLRMLVVAAGVLLLASLVVFLAIGKWKNPFNLHDVPKRLGLEIQQEANGVTITQALGAHSQYKIHASKIVQLKNGNAVLHDVRIELYEEDGSRVDRIVGDEFEYDKQAGTAKASGPVEITLMRPGVAPAIAPKAATGPAAGKMRKDAPLASAAQIAARGQIHVKTSGLIFDQHTGLATTSQRVVFSMAQGSGSSMGATFDRQRGLMVLDRAVELMARRGGEGDETVKIHAQHAEFERETQLCRMHAVTAEYQGLQATAGDSKVLFREDGSAVRLDATSGFTLTTASGGHLAAPTGQMDFDERNQPRHGRLEGGVTMDSASELGSGDGLRRRQLHGSAPSANLEFNTRGKLRHAHLERGVAIDSEESGQAAGQPQHLSRHWRSPVADVDFRDSGRGKIEPVSMRGSGGVVIAGESQRGGGAVLPSRLSADVVTGEFGAGSKLTGMNGVGHASIDETTATGSRQTTSGDRIEVQFAPAGPSGSKRATGSGDEVQSAVVEGHVALTQQATAKPGAAPPAPMRASSGRAVYEAAGEWLHLTLSPRVEDGAVQLTAEKVDVSRTSGDAFAHGNVKATWADSGAGIGGKQGSATGSQGSVALGGQGPAHAVAAETEFRQATGEVTFRGQARLWQQANSIAAPVIVLDRGHQTLMARTTDAATPVRAVLVSAAGPEAGTQQGKSVQPAVIRVRGGDLKYSDAERKAVMHGGVLGAVVAETGTATSSSDQVEVKLLPAGKAVQGQAQVEGMTARGHVVLTSEGRRGTGEQLVFTSATNEYVLTGTATAPPRMTDPARGTVSGEALIFRGRDDSVSVEGGGSKTTTQTTAPK